MYCVFGSSRLTLNMWIRFPLHCDAPDDWHFPFQSYVSLSFAFTALGYANILLPIETQLNASTPTLTLIIILNTKCLSH